MSRSDKAVRLCALASWLCVVLSFQNAAYQSAEQDRIDQHRQARATGRTPALRQAERETDERYELTLIAWTVASGVGSALILLVPPRRKPGARPGAALA